MKRQIFALVTNTAGAVTSTTQGAVMGKLYALEYRPGSIDTGATVTVTCEADASKPLLTKATAGTSNAWFYPRDLVHGVSDGAALTGTAGGDRAQSILNGFIKVVIASGGAVKTGSLIAYIDE